MRKNKNVRLLSLLLVVLTFSSCDENVGKVKDLANQFVESVIAKDKVTLYELYPNTRIFSNLLLPETIKMDGVDVEFDKNDSVYVAKLNDKQSIVCKVDAEEITICDSYNVLRLDSASYDLAAKTGFPVKQMSDITLGQTFSDDSGFISYLERKYPSAANGNLYYSGGYYRWGRNNGSYYMCFDTTISNAGEQPVKGDDYNIEISYTRKDLGTAVSTPSVENGVDLTPGESYVVTTCKPELYRYNPNTGSGLNWNVYFKFKKTSMATLLDRYGSFTGKEYEEFIAEQKELEAAEAKENPGKKTDNEDADSI